MRERRERKGIKQTNKQINKQTGEGKGGGTSTKTERTKERQEDINKEGQTTTEAKKGPKRLKYTQKSETHRIANVAVNLTYYGRHVAT